MIRWDWTQFFAGIGIGYVIALAIIAVLATILYLVDK